MARITLRVYERGTRVRLRRPGPLESGDWKVLGHLLVPSGLAYHLQHADRGNYRVVHARRVRRAPRRKEE